ncbi:hypothetical protein EZJ44_00585 [Arcanobacterium bovis]|uniref:Lipase n=2 Tax=Arcanobacterium bovis TaxID=2529275 RepID=A0A4Q9V2N0_9ACTO|nr:hypothetical protein EZJ44_00585 [Arcanobacterium bovis]
MLTSVALSTVLAVGSVSAASASKLSEKSNVMASTPSTSLYQTNSRQIRDHRRAWQGVKGTDPEGDQYLSFYHDIPDISGMRPGAIIRTQEVNNPWNTLGISENGPYKGVRILYTSINRTGKKIPVSGVVIEPKAPWKGKGSRPLVAFAPGTQGVGDKCAPSRKIADGVGDYEQWFFTSMLKRGYAVVVTDYEGLGTPGMHTYMDRISQGHTVLDSVRAALNLDGWDLSAQTPLAMNGYSQGGGAVASAAELADDYAPELHFKIAIAGAVPADISLIPQQYDGTVYFLAEAYAILGLGKSYGVDFMSKLNEKGKKMMTLAANSCITDFVPFVGVKLDQLTTDGSTVQDLVAAEPYKSMLKEQHIGYDAPSMPVVVTHSRGDDIIPYYVGEKLVSQWRARGADVTFVPMSAGMHVTGTVAHLKIAMQQLANVFGR